jgi:hypothetical protein
MMGWGIYHCGTTFGHPQRFFVSFSLPVIVASAGLNPLTFWWWDDWSSTVLLPLFNHIQPLSSHFLFPECHRHLLDSNPLPWNDEISVLPLCYCLLSPSNLILTFSLSQCQWHMLDSNPWPWNDEISVLPMCYSARLTCLKYLAIFQCICWWNINFCRKESSQKNVRKM